LPLLGWLGYVPGTRDAGTPWRAHRRVLPAALRAQGTGRMRPCFTFSSSNHRLSRTTMNVIHTMTTAFKLSLAHTVPDTGGLATRRAAG
jgi:hypothetical protein